LTLKNSQNVDGARADRDTVIRPLSHQKKALLSKKQEIFLGGGVGAGKTQTGAIWVLLKCMETPLDVYGLIVSNTYSMIYDTSLRVLYEKLQSSGMVVRPAEMPRGRGPADILVWNGSHYVRILVRSLEHYDRLSGLEVGWIWTDEVWLTKPEAIDVLNARLRDTRMENRQILFTTTLDAPDTWMHQRFVEKFNPELQDVIYARTADNPHLPENYVETLKSTYSEAMFKRMVLSEWVTLDTDQVYYAFDRKKHVAPVEPENNLPLLWAHDFNLSQGKPMSSAVMQYHHQSETFTIIDEIIIDGGNTHDSVDEFQSRWADWKAGVIIYGDATGNSRDTRSRTTDFEIMRQAGFRNQKVPRANPPVRERHNCVNALLEDATGRVRIQVHPRCKTVIKGFETTALKKGSRYIEDDMNRNQHVTTAIGYLLMVENPRRPPSLVQTEFRY
jgi:phage terminase large subunit-like protein